MAFNKGLGAAGGLIGAGLGSLFGDWKNPADAGMGSLDEIPDILKPYYNPYIDRGNRMGTDLEDRYKHLLNDPGTVMNDMGKSFQQSPGFKYALEQALQGANHAAAAGGMVGSPQNQKQNMELATNLANQDYNTWLSHALDLYGKGLGGEEGMNKMGYDASNELAQSLANQKMTKAQMQYAGQDAANKNQGSTWGSIFGGIGSLLGLIK